MKQIELTDDVARDLARAFDASPNPYMLLTPDLRYAGMNQAYLKVLGRTREELIGRGLFEIYDGGGDGPQAQANARQLRGSLERVLATGEPDHLALIHYPVEMPDENGGYRIEDRWWSATNSPIRNARGEIVYILQHTTDVTELERLRRRVAEEDDRSAVGAILSGNVLARAEHVQEDNRRLQDERNRLLDIFMQAPGFIAVLTGADHVFQMHNRAYAELTGHRQLDGKTLREALPEIPAQGFGDLLDRVRETGVAHEGRAVEVELARGPQGRLETVYVDFVFQPLRDGDGSVAGVFIQGHDVTQAVMADRRQRLMIDELNHRVKNTLATVQSIAMQTARHHPEPKGFAEAFQSRLMSLSHTHDLLTRSHWEGADLRAVLQHETDAHGGPTRIVPNGPPVALNPAQALSVGMVFHELATNAGKYGALTTPDGRVFVDWSVADQRAPRLILSWRETGGPPVTPPDRRGFGSRLIERNVQHDLAGEVELAYAPDGFRAEISVPLDKGR